MLRYPDWDHRDFLVLGDELQQNITRWLSPPDPWKNHHIARDSHHRGSAAWFIQGNTYLKWKASKAPSSSLWIHGKRASISSSSAYTETECFLVVAGAGKKCFLVCQTYDIPILRAYRVWLAPQSSRTLKLCGKLDWRH